MDEFSEPAMSKDFWEDDRMFNVNEYADPLLSDSNMNFEKVHPSTENYSAGQPQAIIEKNKSRQLGATVAISQSKTENDYKVFSEDSYLVADTNKCVLFDSSTWQEGLKLVVSLRYKMADHENQPVKACPNHSQKMNEYTCC